MVPSARGVPKPGLLAVFLIAVAAVVVPVAALIAAIVPVRIPIASIVVSLAPVAVVDRHYCASAQGNNQHTDSQQYLHDAILRKVKIRTQQRHCPRFGRSSKAADVRLLRTRLSYPAMEFDAAIHPGDTTKAPDFAAVTSCRTKCGDVETTGESLP